MKKCLQNSGQQTVEYILLFCVVIVVLLGVVGTNSFFRNSLDQALGQSINSMVDMFKSIF